MTYVPNETSLVRQARDMTIKCQSCDSVFVFTAGEQSYFVDKGMPFPKRCPACILKRKSSLYRNEDKDTTKSDK
jgi:hypothetical protein